MNTNSSPDPLEQTRQRRCRSAALAGEEHFPSEERYRLATASLENTLHRFPERAEVICKLLDTLTKAYEYQFVIRNTPDYRHHELLSEAGSSLDDVRRHLLALDAPLSILDRGLTDVSIALSLGLEHLERFHRGSAPESFGRAQNYTRRAIESILGFSPNV